MNADLVVLVFHLIKQGPPFAQGCKNRGVGISVRGESHSSGSTHRYYRFRQRSFVSCGGRETEMAYQCIR